MKKIIPIILLSLCVYDAQSQQTIGLFSEDPGSLPGYVLFSPLSSDTTFLIDKCGKLVHQWVSNHTPGYSVYLLPDGHLLRAEATHNATFGNGGSLGGLISKYDWNSQLSWSYLISNDTEEQSHDICPMPNGNIILDVWEVIPDSVAIAAGRTPSTINGSVWSGKLMEIQPVGTDSAIIVWQWRFWDHLVQDYDSTKENYGVVADHPELLNANFFGTDTAGEVDWIHMNAVTYDSVLDQVMISSRNLSEIYIIDHSTTTAQAASHSGGARGKGGDFLFRWGNPASYNMGTSSDRTLYGQHDPIWISAGYTGGNNIMIFNDGQGRPGGNYSSVDIISPPVDGSGNYSVTPGQAFQPDSAYWSYVAPVPTSFYSAVMGGAQRLSNGNTLICEATSGTFFEIDSVRNTVWDYVDPIGTGGGVLTQGADPMGHNSAFRCTLYEPSYSGLAGQTLTPGSPIELEPLTYTCDMFTVDSITGILPSALSTQASFLIANPFSDEIILWPGTDLQGATATLTDVTGRSLETWGPLTAKAGSKTELSMQTSLAEADGIYFLRISDGEMNVTAKLLHR